MLKLYTYHTSVSTHRVRICLNHKSIPYEPIFIDLARESGETLPEEFVRLNPQGLVPGLVCSDDQIITQSGAIMEYIEERYPERPLLPADTEGRARVRSIAQMCIADMHPLNLHRVFYFMRDSLNIEEAKRRAWYEHWNTVGLTALETLLSDHPETGSYCHGEQPTFADVCLVPQVHNAEVHGINLDPYPTVRRIYRTCMTLASFQAAAPEAQLDGIGLK